MAYLRRLLKSPFWIACFRLPDGRQTNRSTGTTNRQEAQRIANKYEDTSKDGRAGKLTEIRARKAISDIFAISNRDVLPSSTIENFMESWLKRKEMENGAKTHQRYETVIRQLLEFIGARARKDLAHLTSKELVEFRDSTAKRVSAGTANLSVKIIRTALGQARRDGLIDVNEGERVSLLKRGKNKIERRPFTLPELKKVLAVADEEWRGMILTGLYTGLRLGDVANLTWANVDLEQRGIQLVTEKTGRRQLIPLAKPLLAYVESLPAGDVPGAPLFPKAAATRDRSIYSGGLSNQFYQILVAAGLAKKKSHAATKQGRSARRQQNELGFHCLRHTATSLLKNAGVSDVIARDIIGHESAAVSQQYTHIDQSTKRAALNKLPDVRV